MPPGVAGRETAALVVARGGADELLALRARQRADGAVEPELRERLGLALPRPEAGTPEQTLGLLASEGASIDGNPHPTELSAGRGFPSASSEGQLRAASPCRLCGRRPSSERSSALRRVAAAEPDFSPPCSEAPGSSRSSPPLLRHPLVLQRLVLLLVLDVRRLARHLDPFRRRGGTALPRATPPREHPDERPLLAGRRGSGLAIRAASSICCGSIVTTSVRRCRPAVRGDFPRTARDPQAARPPRHRQARTWCCASPALRGSAADRS